MQLSCQNGNLDIIIYDSKWSDNEELASMRNGSGDEYLILFNIRGAILKGYDRESKFASYFAKYSDRTKG